MSGLRGHFWWFDINTFHHATNFKSIAVVKAAANRPVTINGMFISTNGITAANPKPLWGLQLVTGSPTPGGTGFLDQAANYNDANNLAGVRRIDRGSETMQTLISCGPSADAAWTTDFTADTTGEAWIIGPRYLHEQNDWQWQNTLPAPIIIPAGTYAALRVRNTNAAGVLCSGWIDFEE